MGMVQSDQTRSITIENEPRTGQSILVSEEVKKRIYESFTKGDECVSPGSKPNVPQLPSFQPTQIDEIALDSYNSPPKAVNPKDLTDENGPSFLSDHKSIQHILNKTNAIMEEEFHSSYAEVQDTFATQPSPLWEPPCQELKSKLFRCYSDNPSETLLCVGEARAFTDCVNRSRIRQLDQKQGTHNLPDDIKI